MTRWKVDVSNISENWIEEAFRTKILEKLANDLIEVEDYNVVSLMNLLSYNQVSLVNVDPESHIFQIPIPARKKSVRIAMVQATLT